MTLAPFITLLGDDLRNSKDLTLDLVSLICARPVLWEKAIALKGLTHIIDFGPGGTSGIGALTHRNKEGTGVQIVLAGALEGNNRDLSYKADLFDSDIRAVTYSQDWAKAFQPKLVKTSWYVYGNGYGRYIYMLMMIIFYFHIAMVVFMWILACHVSLASPHLWLLV